MEANKRLMETKLNDEGYIYVFETKGEMGAKPPTKFRRKIWQLVPSICATLVCLPYGIMLGWPSPTYPNLTRKDTSDIFITMDQSAMVAGFLMIGNTLGTPFSSLRRLGPKYGIIIGVTFMTVGWIMMWQAQDIYWLLGSRFLIGAGNGFAIGQLKFYISEICEEGLAQFLIKQINLYIFFGVILAFSFGPFVGFRQFSIISSVVTILVLFLAIFLPSTPKELVKSGKFKEAEKLIAFLSPHLNVGDEMKKLKEKAKKVETELSFCDIIKQSSLRKNFLIFAFSVFFQQFSGAPATIIYSQMIFDESGCPRPKLCAIVYSLVYFLANVYGIFCVSSHNKKHLLLFSSIGASILILVKILVLVQNINETLWNFSSLVVLLFFIVVHTVGLGNVPFRLIPELFPKEARKVVIHFFIMFHSMLALTITKIFQVMMTQIDLFAPFCLFLVISTFSIIFVIIFVPSKSKSVENT